MPTTLIVMPFSVTSARTAPRGSSAGISIRFGPLIVASLRTRSPMSPRSMKKSATSINFGAVFERKPATSTRQPL